jgi:hypothetical protein
MKSLKRNILLGLLFTVFVLNPAVYATSYSGGHTGMPVSVKIASPKTTIDMGEPLILKFTYIFEEPQINAETGDVYSSIRNPPGPLIEIKDTDNDWLANFPDYTPFEKDGIKYFPLDLPSLQTSSLYVQDKKGLEYSNYVLIPYELYKKSFVFDEPGTYKFCTLSTGMKVFSNVIDIRLTSQMQEEKAALLDQNVCEFLMRSYSAPIKDPNYRSKLMTNLKNMIKQDPNSLLSKLAAAQLGFEGLRDDRHEKYEAIREKREPSWPLYQQAKVYLRMGLELPDDFSVRQNILWELTELEEGNENYSQSLLYLNELADKYPKGKYRTEIVSGKVELAELIELQKRELEQDRQNEQSNLPDQRNMLLRMRPIVGVAIAAVVIFGFVLLLKKKSA